MNNVIDTYLNGKNAFAVFPSAKSPRWVKVFETKALAEVYAYDNGYTHIVNIGDIRPHFGPGH